MLALGMQTDMFKNDEHCGGIDDSKTDWMWSLKNFSITAGQYIFNKIEAFLKTFQERLLV